MIKKEDLIKEMEFCLELWKKNGGCEFGGSTKCKDCATLYLLLKLINGEVLHGKNIKKMSLDDWEKRLKEIKNNIS